MTDDCLFCKIIAGEIPSNKVYEDDKTFAFLDLRPINPGHTLVIHKHHHVDIFDTPEEDLCDLVRTAKKLAKAILDGTNAEGINIGMNNKPAAGQLVFHAHIHVMPRLTGDGHTHWKGAERTPEEQAATAEAIKQALQ